MSHMNSKNQFISNVSCNLLNNAIDVLCALCLPALAKCLLALSLSLVVHVIVFTQTDNDIDRLKCQFQSAC